MSETGINRLALHAVHEALGATFELRGGWRLPETYGDSEDEYARLRSNAVAFDRSDRTRLLLSGTDAGTVLEAVFGREAGELEEGRAVRAAALDAMGRIADLALIARTGGIAYMVMGEPGRGATTLAMLEGAVGEGYDVVIQDRTATTCLVGIAGPGAAAAAAQHVNEALPPRLPSMHAAPFEFHGYRALAIRTGGVGEDGFELMVAPPVAEHLLGLLQSAGGGAGGHGRAGSGAHRGGRASLRAGPGDGPHTGRGWPERSARTSPGGASAPPQRASVRGRPDTAGGGRRRWLRSRSWASFAAARARSRLTLPLD